MARPRRAMAQPPLRIRVQASFPRDPIRSVGDISFRLVLRRLLEGNGARHGRQSDDVRVPGQV